MALTDGDIEVIEDKIELGVRRYFDHYLETILPQQLESMFEAHDGNHTAHGGIVKRFEWFKWALIGISFGGGLGGGVGLAKLLSLVS